MKNWIDIRRWIRPDQPQPNYKAALGTALWEAPLYVAIAAATLNCSLRTPERPKLEVTRHAWANESVYEATANLWEAPLYVPIGDAQRTGSVRTRERGTFDVRHTWVNEPVYKASVALFDVDQVVAPVSAQQSSVRTPARAAFDLPRHTTDPQVAWFASALAPDATIPQRAAVWSQLANPGTTKARAALDVRTHAWEIQPSWAPTSADLVIGTWVPIFDAQRNSVRTPARPVFDARGYSSYPDSAWAFVNLPAGGPSAAQIWPALQQGQVTGRTTTRSTLDVRLTGDVWPAWIVAILPTDSTVAQQAAIWSQTANPGRTRERGGDVRIIHTDPAFSWVATALDRTIATWAPIFKAQESQRTRERGGDVRRIQTEPIFAWPSKVVDAIVAKWAPVFLAQASPRTAQRRVLDVRAITDQPEISWLFPVIPTTQVTVGVIHLTGSNQPIIILTGQGSGGVFDLTVFDPTVFDTGNTIVLTGSYQPIISLTGQGSDDVFDHAVFDPAVFDTVKPNTIVLTGSYQPVIVLTGSVE